MQHVRVRGMIRAAALAAGALVLMTGSACGGLQPEDSAKALREGGAAMAQLKTVTAALKFTKGAITFQGYTLVGAKATLRLPADSDTVYTVRYQDLLIGLEVVISGGHVYLRPPLSGFTEVTGKNAADIPDVARLFDLKTGLPALIPAGQNPKYITAEKVGDIDSHKITTTYTALQIESLLPQLKSAGDVAATIWVGGSDHLIRKAVLDGNFGDNGAASSVEVDLSGFNAPAAIATPSP
jgi:LppX/LprAFG-like lipoprotein